MPDEEELFGWKLQLFRANAVNVSFISAARTISFLAGYDFAFASGDIKQHIKLLFERLHDSFLGNSAVRNILHLFIAVGYLQTYS